MKMVLKFGQCVGLWPTLSAAFFPPILAAAFFAAGCSKSSSPPPAVTAPPDASAAAPATPAPSPAVNANPQPASAANSTVSTQDLQSLNRVLMRWMIQNHRHPKTFEEFAGSTDYQIPAPPPGKKYTLNARGFIILVND